MVHRVNRHSLFRTNREFQKREQGTAPDGTGNGADRIRECHPQRVMRVRRSLPVDLDRSAWSCRGDRCPSAVWPSSHDSPMSWASRSLIIPRPIGARAARRHQSSLIPTRAKAGLALQDISLWMCEVHTGVTPPALITTRPAAMPRQDRHGGRTTRPETSDRFAVKESERNRVPGDGGVPS